MPSDIKKAAIALIISCIACLIAVYFDGIDYEEIGYSNSFILGFNILWVFIIAWIIWDLFKGKSIKWTLILVGLIMLVSTIWDTLNYGFGMAQLFYAIELLFFIVAFLFISTQRSKTWYAEKANSTLKP